MAITLFNSHSACCSKGLNNASRNRVAAATLLQRLQWTLHRVTTVWRSNSRR